MKSGFSWKSNNDKDYNLKLISLMYKDAEDPLHNMEVQITPTLGCNMCKFDLGCNSIIKYNPSALNKSRFFGNPILYPTPNRVMGCKFDFKGTTYKQIKNGKERYLHGLVYDEEWQYDLPIRQADCITFKTWIDFLENSPMFEAFPFKHKLIVVFKLDVSGIKITYLIENNDDRELPFGFALHPFFEKLSGDTETFITISTDYIMESTPDCLPTGVINSVDNTRFDIRKPTAVGELDIDHNYIGLRSITPSIISYGNKPFYLSLDTSDEFTHLVLFTPQGENFFCMENQTCSTDAHNLYNQGLKEDSGLLIVSPGQIHQGFIKYSVHFNDAKIF